MFSSVSSSHSHTASPSLASHSCFLTPAVQLGQSGVARAERRLLPSGEGYRSHSRRGPQQVCSARSSGHVVRKALRKERLSGYASQ